MEGDPRVRVLVVFEEEYRAYRDAIAGTIRALRTRTEVTVADTDALEAETTRLSPHVVICSRPKALDPGRTLAWVELPHDPGLAGKIHLGGECSQAHNLALDDLLAVIDGAERVIRA